jgi:hypothetical protein
MGTGGSGPPTWKVVPSGATQVLYGIWGASPNDLWAVGYQSTILRGDGTSWSTVLTNGSSTSGFRSVWGSSANDVWIGADAQGLMDRFKDGAWSTFYTQVANYRIWGSGPSDIWSIAGNLAHFDGTAWTKSTAISASGCIAVWGAATDDVWLAGSGSFVHWDGVSWTYVNRPASVPFNAIWGSGSDDVWAMGNGGVVAHWNGALWTMVDVGLPSVDFRSIWGSAQSDVWAVGSSVAIHYDGTTWTAAPTGGPRNLYDVWGFGPNNVWAVGAAGLILHRQ